MLAPSNRYRGFIANDRSREMINEPGKREGERENQEVTDYCEGSLINKKPQLRGTAAASYSDPSRSSTAESVGHALCETHATGRTRLRLG